MLFEMFAAASDIQTKASMGCPDCRRKDQDSDNVPGSNNATTVIMAPTPQNGECISRSAIAPPKTDANGGIDLSVYVSPPSFTGWNTAALKYQQLVLNRFTDRIKRLKTEIASLKRVIEKQHNGELACLDIMAHAKDVASLRSKGREYTEKRRLANEIFEEQMDLKLIGTGSEGEAYKLDTNGKPPIVLKALPCAADSKEALSEKLDKGLKEVKMQKMAAIVCPDGVVAGHLAFSYELPSEAAAALSIEAISDGRINKDAPAVPPNTPLPSPPVKGPTVSFSDETAQYRSMLIIAMEACIGSFAGYMKNCTKNRAVVYFSETLKRFHVVCQTVETMHSNDIEHNDLHSENVFVYRGRKMTDAPLIGDFGDAQTRQDAEKKGYVFGLLDAKHLGQFLHDIFAEFFSKNQDERENWPEYLREKQQIPPSLLERFNAENFPSKARGALQRLVDCIVPMITAAECEVVPPRIVGQLIVAIENALQSLKV